ncbi:hypothetical protein BLNAU_23808 [Blattamonas nauphoetae]|uniref:Uncharacterized protein n=1 Tax=Blattamonas nauphoetae TaxID=2049346 RepID=A0ABQ9WP71_9EUKA|nr:hypothetical protein BLNAU_23808 [Blattamonas nauphoetae]
MTDSSGNSAFTRSITNTEGTELTKCTTMDETVKESKLLPLKLLVKGWRPQHQHSNIWLSHPFKLFICKHHLSLTFGTEDQCSHIRSVCRSGVHPSDIRRFIQYQKIEQFIRSRHFVQIQRICGRPHYVWCRLIGHFKKDGLLIRPDKEAGLVICLTLARRRSSSERWTEVQPNRIQVAVTTEPALVCDLSFEVDTGTQKTWKSWN